MAEEWAWLDERPVFTAHGEEGGNVTRGPPGAVLEPLRAGFVLLVMGLASSVGLVDRESDQVETGTDSILMGGV